ncbi:methyltransferase, FkbM family [Spirosomataceae bacterium TFI 002]|nr:methyltransferase, FkbM family [Spirosomataceae bacterium TFI 002]
MFSTLYGRKALQPIFKKVFSFAVRGLNYGMVGSGEKWVLNYIKSKLVKPKVIFDVGANIGEYCIDLRSVFGSSPTIYAFEPIAQTYEMLVENCRDIDIKTINIGLGDKDEITSFFINPSQHTFASKFSRQNSEAELHTKVDVKINRIDSFCKNQNLTNIDFLKLDIEGNEFNALKGAEEMLAAGKIKFIQFEFGGTSLDARVYFRDFWEALSSNYKLYRILKDGLDEIETYHLRNEVFYYSNYLAELKTSK